MTSVPVYLGIPGWTGWLSEWGVYYAKRDQALSAHEIESGLLPHVVGKTALDLLRLIGWQLEREKRLEPPNGGHREAPESTG